ncbi:hypothetical protein KHP60_17400 [Microvirga sp. 3-52]|uniref:hypothetical protein n=1 Tax=Microvirga sp. 3-52 TaxID=2792425 RepID=UPI001ACB2078|nr:hypothetical protein [Microvirga sp. 3-52]MBO1907068.1 hypothetical protein [Microvirga sp. 3-52]MBS7454110.1 hypothetical protein [Microvirga sp. 3-52]
MIVGWIDLMGYAASGLTLATFAQKTMMPMRIMAIGANICFIGYGAMGLFIPVLALHVVLLPVNLVRLRALVRQSRRNEISPDGEGTDRRMDAGISSGLI